MRYAFAPVVLSLSLLGACGGDERAAPVESAPQDASMATAEVALDPISGLKMTGDWQLVRNNCIGCHSAALVTQQRGDAAQWLGMIRWMQAKQGLWQLDAETENAILDYLATNYGPTAASRRPSLEVQFPE